MKFFLATTAIGVIAFTLLSQKSYPLPEITDEWWGGDTVPQTEDVSIRPFKIEIPDEVFVFHFTDFVMLLFIWFSTGYCRSSW